MSVNILLVGASPVLNLGGPSMLQGTMKALREVFPGAEFSLMCRETRLPGEKRLIERCGVTALPLSRVSFRELVAGAVRRLTGLLLGRCTLPAMTTAFERADVVVDIWGIAFADSLGRNTFRYRAVGGGAGALHAVLAKIMGKPMVKYTADLGPFNERWNRFFAKLYLQRFYDLILARDQASYDCVVGLGVRTPMLCVPDTAFLLDPVDGEQSHHLAAVRQERAVVGISVSHQAYNRAPSREGYLDSMASLARHIIKRGMHVVLLPNELYHNKPLKDDEDLSKAIEEQVQDGRCEVVITRQMSGEQVKGVIRQFDGIVAARYHSIIAALSMGIPVLAIGWHHKYEGVLSRFGLSEWVCDVSELQAAALCDRFDALWEQRVSIRKDIEASLPGIKETIHAGALEVRALLDKRHGAGRKRAPDRSG